MEITFTTGSTMMILGVASVLFAILRYIVKNDIRDANTELFQRLDATYMRQDVWAPRVKHLESVLDKRP